MTLKIILTLIALIITNNANELEDVSLLSELPLSELLSQKKLLNYGNSSVDDEILPGALPLVGNELSDDRIDPMDHMQVKGLHRMPIKRGHYEEEEEEEEEYVIKKKKSKSSKIQSIFNTSITALSFLAFGGYLICLLANALQKKKQEMLATTVTPAQQMMLLQQYLSGNRPFPFRLPETFAFYGRRKKRFADFGNLTNYEDFSDVNNLMQELKLFSEGINLFYKN